MLQEWTRTPPKDEGLPESDLSRKQSRYCSNGNMRTHWHYIERASMLAREAAMQLCLVRIPSLGREEKQSTVLVATALMEKLESRFDSWQKRDAVKALESEWH